jgi:DNA-binding NtrC family response regulator
VTRILIADDERSIRIILGTVLKEDGAEVVEAATVAEAVVCLNSQAFDAAIIDQKFPDGEGTQILAHARQVDPALPVIVITAYATVELAVDLMRDGAFDFLPKPFHPEAVKASLRRASERSRLERENARLRLEAMDYSGRDFVGNSPAMAALRKRIAQVAPTDATVLLRGETGTGKELVARAIHTASRRAGEAFIAVNCAALPEALLESELFGHEKGAFTGAERSREGLFEAASGGTIFLDEAGEMSLALQAKLLRVLNDGTITRLGSTASRQCNVRVVAATNRDLKKAVATGEFREDLYYRIAVFPITLPPLRNRLSDLPEIAAFLLTRSAKNMAVPLRRLSSSAMAVLMQHGWPGNIRELANVLERATITADGDLIQPEDIQLEEGQLDIQSLETSASITALDSLSLNEALVTLETRMIKKALEQANGVQAEAARCLGISRSDLLYKIRKLNLTSSTHRNRNTAGETPETAV